MFQNLHAGLTRIPEVDLFKAYGPAPRGVDWQSCVRRDRRVAVKQLEYALASTNAAHY